MIAVDNSASGSSGHSIAGCANPFDKIKSGLKVKAPVVCAKP